MTIPYVDLSGIDINGYPMDESYMEWTPITDYVAPAPETAEGTYFPLTDALPEEGVPLGGAGEGVPLVGTGDYFPGIQLDPATGAPTGSYTGTQLNDAENRAIEEYLGPRLDAIPGWREVSQRLGMDEAGNLVDTYNHIIINPSDIPEDVRGTLQSAVSVGRGLFDWIPPGAASAAAWFIGLSSLGALVGQAFAPEAPRFRPPTPTPPPESQVMGQRALASALAGGGGAPGAPPASLGAPPTSLVSGMPRPNVQQDPTTGQWYQQDPTTGQWSPVSPRQAGPSPAGVDWSALGPSPAGAQADLATAMRYGMAGQRNVADIALGATARELATQAEQYPGERAARLTALGDIPGLLQPTATLAPTVRTGLAFDEATMRTLGAAPAAGATLTPAALSDPVAAMMAEQVQRVLRGELPTPELDRASMAEEQQLRGELMRAHGAGYETSSPGIEALTRLRESQAIRREQYRMNVLGSMAPQEFQRRQFNIQQPESQFIGRLSTFAPSAMQRAQFAEQTQAQRLGQNYAIAGNFGRTPPERSATTLSSLVPIPSILGLDAANNAAAQQNALQNQVALEDYRRGYQEQQNIASGIGGMFGTAAGLSLSGGGRGWGSTAGV